MIIDKALILNKIKEHYSFKSDAAFARFLEIKPQTLATWYSRNTFDIELLYAKCEGIDGNFLLSGNGEILRNSLSESKNEPKKVETDKEIERLKDKISDLQTINELLTRTVADLDKSKTNFQYPNEQTVLNMVDEPEPELKKPKKDDAKK